MLEQEARRLVETYSDLIFRISFTYLKSKYDAEDICQNVFLKYLNADIVYDNPEHEKAWIIRCTINTCKDVLKSAYRTKIMVTDRIPEISSHQEDSSAVREAVMNLPESYRAAIFLYYFEGYSTKEIAEITGKSENAVAKQLSRGRRQLSKTLENYEKGRMRYYGKKLEG